MPRSGQGHAERRFRAAAYLIHCVDGGTQISQFGLLSLSRIQHWVSALAGVRAGVVLFVSFDRVCS